MTNKNLLKTINNMVKVDQEARFLDSPLDKINVPMYAKRLVRTVDTAHNHQIKEITREHGYPTKKLIGKNGMRSFWLLIQHQDFDIKLQKECLRECNFGAQEYAHLCDRIQVNTGKLQVYGTQLNKPIGEISEANIERQKLGLKSLESNLKEINKDVPPGYKKLKIKISKNGNAFYVKT